MSKKKYWKAQQAEAERAAYQYGIKNGVSQNEAMAAVNYAKAKGISPKDLTPKSQVSSTAIGNKLCNSSCTSSTSTTSSSKTNSTTNSSSNNSTSSTNTTSSNDSISSLLSLDNIKALFTELLNMFKNIFNPAMQNNYGIQNNYGMQFNNPNNGASIFGNMYNQRPQPMDPNQYANKYAQANNISLEDAKQKLQSMYGAPQQNASFSQEC